MCDGVNGLSRSCEGFLSRSPRYSGGGPPSGGAPPPSGHQSWDDHSCTKYLPQVSCFLLHVQNTPQGPTPGIGWCSRYFLWLDKFCKSCFGGRVILKHGFLHPKTVGHRLPCTANAETQTHKDKYTKTNTQRQIHKDIPRQFPSSMLDTGCKAKW